MNIQIFGTKKCNDTKKAERFFKERRIKYQFIDLKEKSFCDCLLDFETKYGKSLPDLYSDKLLLQQFIQYLRNYSNITIREIAKELNLSKSTIANYCKK